MKEIAIVFLMVIFLGACSTTEKLMPSSYMDYVTNPSHNMRFTIDHNEVVYSLQYIPYDFDRAKCIREKCMPIDSIRKMSSEDFSTTTFMLRMEVSKGDLFVNSYNGTLPKEKRLEYFSFGAKDDIGLITVHKDTLRCSHLMFERGMANSPIGTFYIDFPMIKMVDIEGFLWFNRAYSQDPIMINLEKIQQAQLPKLKVKDEN